MDWHLTWQDPVALLCVIACLAVAWWLRRRFAGTGCDGCSAREAESPGAARTGPEATAVRRVATADLRLGRPR